MVSLSAHKCFAMMLLMVMMMFFQLSLASASNDESAVERVRRRGLTKPGFLQGSWEPMSKRVDPNLSIDNSLEGLKLQLEHRQRILEMQMEQDLLDSISRR